MRIRSVLIVLFMVATGVIGCREPADKEKPQPPFCPDCPYADAPYPQKCPKCGAEWCSSSIGGSESPSDACPNCPLDICPETAGLILTIGPLMELVRHQPDNQDARQRLAAAEAKFKAHCDSCQKCRDALQ